MNTAREFIEHIARMKTLEEFGDNKPEDDDWILTVNELIEWARKIIVLPDCHRCLENFPNNRFVLQTYSVCDDKLGIDLLINVTAAYDFARRHLTPIEIPKKHHEYMMLVNRSETFCGQHVEHVDRTKPAIMGMRDGMVMLMDGTHRLFAWIKHGEPPVAYILNEEQTAKFIMREMKR